MFGGTDDCVKILNFSYSGYVTIPGGVTFIVHPNFNETGPQFTLTSISYGGPSTTVTWSKDSATAMRDEMTVLNNATTAQYTHTLTVTGRLGGVYTCTVSNAKPSEAVASFNTQGNVYCNCIDSPIQCFCIETLDLIGKEPFLFPVSSSPLRCWKKFYAISLSLQQGLFLFI